MLDAEPDLILKMPGDSPWPFVTTLAMSAAFIGLLLQLVVARPPARLRSALPAPVWLWPRRALGQIAGSLHD